MFRRLLVPIKPALKPRVELGALVTLARAAHAALLFVSVEGSADVALTGRSAALALDVMHESRDLANAALRWIQECTAGENLQVETYVVKGDVVQAVLAAAREHACDAIVLTQHPKTWLAPLTGSIGDAIARQSRLPVLILKP